MIKVKNLTSGEIIEFKGDIVIRDGKVVAYWKKPDPTKLQPWLVRTNETWKDAKHGDVECRVFEIANGWELLNEKTAPKAPKAPKAKSTKKTAKVVATPKVAEPVAPAPEPVPVKASEPEPDPTLAAACTAIGLGADADKLKKSLAKKYGAMAEDILAAACTLLQGAITGTTDAAAVRAIANEVFAGYASTAPKQAKLVAKAAKAKATKEYFCKDFDDIKKDIEDGYHVYLYGAAGSGKTHTAAQVAEQLGLDFYTQTTVQFAHDVRGYGDAGGKFVETPFYKAFAFGGLYFQDEFDRSFAEAAIVLNTALANRYYDFPVVGRVQAHPNFRFMAAGNTLMKGQDDQYVTGQVIDASSRDRFGSFYECEYNHDVELYAIAHGDAELVSFVEDVRRAIKATDISHVVSYRATDYMSHRKENKEKTLVRNTFKGLLSDDIRMIYGALKDKDNVWAKAMKKII